MYVKEGILKTTLLQNSDRGTLVSHAKKMEVFVIKGASCLKIGRSLIKLGERQLWLASDGRKCTEQCCDIYTACYE